MVNPISADDELETPQTGSRWRLLSYAIFYPVFIGLIWVAAWNLWHFRERKFGELFASGCWLLLNGFACYGLWYHVPGSVRQCCINWLGQFGARQLAWIERSEGELPIVCFGYELWGRRFKYGSVQADRIRSVEWSLGQLSSIIREDKDDWHVYVWFRVEQQSHRAGEIERNGERLSLRLVGTQGPKQAIAEFGLRFVRFVERMGIVMVPSDDGCRYSVVGGNEGERPEFWKMNSFSLDWLEPRWGPHSSTSN
ncbi:MAG: hypothetical protein H7062_15775 [Candidatus Saccharimonas sp.]|nr:hypothetical protein [Planctomycetaceae bacterium]